MSHSHDNFAEMARRMSDAELIATQNSIKDADNMTPLEEAVVDEIDRRDL